MKKLNKKGRSEMGGAIKLFGVLFLVGCIVVGGFMYMGQKETASAFKEAQKAPKDMYGGVPEPDGVCPDGKTSYAGTSVTYTITSRNGPTGADVNPTYYLYVDEPPKNWGNSRSTVEDGYDYTDTASSATATFDIPTGHTYYIRADLSTYYTEWFVAELGECFPIGYDPAPKKTINFYQADTLSFSAADTGSVANSSSEQVYTATSTETVTDNYGYKLDEIRIMEDPDGTYTPFTDTDNDAIFNEYVKKIEITITCGGVVRTYVPWDTAASIDDFGGDNVAIMDYELGECELREKGKISFDVDFTCGASLDTASAGDEKCGNGEDMIELSFIDQMGTSETISPTF